MAPPTAAKTAHFDILEHVLPGCHIREYAGSSAGRQEDIQKLHIKQYVPRNQEIAHDKYAVTIIAMHGISLPKELYEPLWDDLYEQAHSHGFSIRGIWIADMANHGMSGILNEDVLSNDDSWMDHSRDVLLMINHFRDQMPRPLIGIGHSCGAVQLANLSALHPRLFTAVLFLDPGFLKTRTPIRGLSSDTPGPVNFNTYRRDLWPNRVAAAASIRKSSSDWDDRVVDLIIEHGFRNLPTNLYPELPADADPSDPPVTLTTTKHHSCLMQQRPCFDFRGPDGRVRVNRNTHADLDAEKVLFPLYRPELLPSTARLRSLRPSALFVLGKYSTWSLSDMHDASAVTGIDVGGSGGMPEGRVLEVMVSGGHMFPFTHVRETAQTCASWPESEMTRFRDWEKQWDQQRSKMSKLEHARLPDKWFELISHPTKPPSSGKGKL